MFQTEVRRGSHVVIITSNRHTEGPFRSRLYVNGGETATLLSRQAKTLKGAEKQAEKLLGMMSSEKDA